MKKLIFGIGVFTLVSGVIAVVSIIKLSDSQAQKVTSHNKTGISSSLLNPSSISVLVNKQHPLNPLTYTPNDLVVPNIPLRTNITSDEKMVSAVIAPSLEAMVMAAKNQGVSINLQSGYRSYSIQAKLYNEYVQEQGQAVADTQSARAGYSEHQTGLAVDLGDSTVPNCDVHDCFATTPAGEWLAANAYKYGFILRYPANTQNVTGYTYEPWHYRYIGTQVALAMHNKNVSTLEQYFNLN